MSYIPALRDAERISIENKCKPPLLVENRLIGIITYFVVAIIISPALLIIILGPSAWLMTFDTAILASILEKDEKK
jgi:hypothetical protein